MRERESIIERPLPGRASVSGRESRRGHLPSIVSNAIPIPPRIPQTPSQRTSLAGSGAAILATMAGDYEVTVSLTDAEVDGSIPRRRLAVQVHIIIVGRHSNVPSAVLPDP